jgi:hypothetical protein
MVSETFIDFNYIRTSMFIFSRLSVATRIVLPCVIVVRFCVAEVTALQPRQEFTIPLLKISIGQDDQSQQYTRVKIYQSNERDQSIITALDDTYIKSSNKGSEKSIYRETADRAYQISTFEAQELNKVCKGFTEILDIFERDLKDGRFDRCRYLDAFLPRFLKAFYVLMALAESRDDQVKIDRLITDDEFDVSLNSAKTDSRIEKWQSVPDYLMKLRITTKELLFQLRTWQKKELSAPDRNPERSRSDEVLQTLELFINVYFNNAAELKTIPQQ